MGDEVGDDDKTNAPDGEEDGDEVGEGGRLASSCSLESVDDRRLLSLALALSAISPFDGSEEADMAGDADTVRTRPLVRSPGPFVAVALLG